jgi:hypothetical protein
MAHPFEVGKTYRNRAGEYVVLAIDGARMTIRYASGGTLVTDVDIQARIWENIQFEQQMVQTEERQRQAREARTAARRRTARARKAKAKPTFDGFEKSDFEPKKRGLAWSSRNELGKVLAHELGQRAEGSFAFWIVPRRPKVHIAREEVYDRNALERNASFFVIVEETGMTYGFRVGKPDGKVESGWPWSSVIAVLEESATVRRNLRAAMKAHELSLDVYAMQTSFGRVGRITLQDRGFLWEHETAEQEVSRKMNWAQLVEYLQTVAPAKRCTLYLRKHVSPGTALKAGAGIAAEIADVFESLVPLYDASVGV